jgi:ferredoxin
VPEIPVFFFKENNMRKRIGVLFFSPTSTIKKICNAVALGMGTKEPQIFNMTFPETRMKIIAHSNTITFNIDHFIIGAPVYFGKLPLQVIECLQSIAGNGKECSAIVVFGNRDYGIALYSMVEILSNNGFTVIAAGAFIGQHSYSDIVPVVLGRPDKSDIEKAYHFGVKSLEDIPVQHDIFSRSDKYIPLRPDFISEQCNQCGTCAIHCPLGILSPDTGTYYSHAAEDKCLGCMACVFNCMNQARNAKPNVILKFVMNLILKQAAIERKEPVTIFA